MSLSSIFTDTLRKIRNDNTKNSKFPYTTPNESTTYSTSNRLFQETVSDDELLESFTRNPFSKVIVNDVAEDVFDKGFTIELFDEDEATDIEQSDDDVRLTTEYLRVFDLQIRAPLILTYKLARLYGWGLLLYGFDDGLPLDQPPQPGSEIKYFQSIDPSWIEEIEYYKDEDDNMSLPIKIKRYKMIETYTGTVYIHPRRVAHIENPGIDVLKTGVSALLACYDDLLVMKHVVWGAGQTMWRSGNQLVIAIGPPRANDAQLQSIDDALVDVNARTAMTFPYGTDVNTNSPSGLNPSPYAEIPINNISAATRIPISILIGSQAGALASSLTDARDYAGTLSGIQNNVLSPILHEIFTYLQLSHQIEYQKIKIVWESTMTMSKPEETLVDYRNAITEERLWDLEQKKKEVAGKQPLTTIEQAMQQPPSNMNATPSELGPGMEVAPV